MNTNEVCFSPPGPGQCQPWHEVRTVDEPGVWIILLLAGAIAYLAGRKK